MAKDRFSRFKPNSYVVGYSNSAPKMNWVKTRNRKKLNDTQRKFIVNLIQQNKLTDWELSFTRSILVEGEVPTPKQASILRSMILKYE